MEDPAGGTVSNLRCGKISRPGACLRKPCHPRHRKRGDRERQRTVGSSEARRSPAPTACTPITAHTRSNEVFVWKYGFFAIFVKVMTITNSRGLLKLMSIESVMPSNHLILCHPFLLPPSIFPSIRVFSNESFLPIRRPNYWSFSFKISPSNEYSGLISFRID